MKWNEEQSGEEWRGVERRGGRGEERSEVE